MVFFYGGQVICMQGKIKIENLDFILDLIDEYIELVEITNIKCEKEETKNEICNNQGK